MEQTESRRIHEDWWGECRTCRFWTGDRATKQYLETGECTNKQSYVFGKLVWRSFDCCKWDTFDIDVALALLQEWEVRFGKEKKL